MSETVILKLKHPVELGKQLVEELTFRRGRLGDLKGTNIQAGNAPTMEDLMAIAGKLCGQTMALMERIDEEDAGEVLHFAIDFFARCLESGAKP